MGTEEKEIEETSREGVRRLRKELPKLGLTHKIGRKGRVLCSLHYSADILINKFKKRWGIEPEVFCFLKMGIGKEARGYILLGTIPKDS